MIPHVAYRARPVNGAGTTASFGIAPEDRRETHHAPGVPASVPASGVENGGCALEYWSPGPIPARVYPTKLRRWRGRSNREVGHLALGGGRIRASRGHRPARPGRRPQCDPKDATAPQSAVPTSWGPTKRRPREPRGAWRKGTHAAAFGQEIQCDDRRGGMQGCARHAILHGVPCRRGGCTRRAPPRCPLTAERGVRLK